MQLLPPCPVCSYIEYGPERHVNGYILRRCMECDALVCVSEFKSESDNEKNQLETSSEFYINTIESEEINSLRSIVEFLIEKRPNLGRVKALDFGAGQGGLALASSYYFQQSWACDINYENLLRNILNHNKENVKAIHSTDQIPSHTDAVFCWHTIEHIPNAHEVLREVAQKIAPGGAMLWQVPMYKPDHLAGTHYTFFNEFSAEYLCNKIGMKMLDYFIDADRYFLTVLAEK